MNECCCGTCRFHKWDNDYSEYVCGCSWADMYGLETNYEDSCCDYEEGNE